MSPSSLANPEDLGRRLSELVADTGPDAVLLVLDGSLAWASAAAGRVLGVEPLALVGSSPAEYVHPDDRARLGLWDPPGRRGAGALHQAEIRIRIAGGSWRTVRATVQGLPDVGVQAHVIVWRESGMDAASGAARAFATLAEGTRVLLRSKSEAELLHEMCQAACSDSGYLFAWYGVPLDDPEKSVRVAAVGGRDLGYADTARVSWGDGPNGQGATGRCLRTGTTQVSLDLVNDPRFAPWRDAALERGIGSSIALPVRCDAVLHGALMVYAKAPDAFDAPAVELLEYLAADLGYGLARLRGQAALATSEERYRLLAEHATDLVFLTGPDLRVEWVSPSVQAVAGWRPQDLIGEVIARDYLHPEDAANLRELLARVPRESVLTGRMRLRCADGSYRWMSVGGSGVSNPDGSPRGRVVSMRDIDEQVAAEDDLRRREVQYRLLAENAMDMVFAVAADGVIQWVSPSVRTVLGYQPEQLVGRTAAAVMAEDDLATLRRTAARVAEGMVVTDRPRFRTADGRLVWMESTTRPLRDELGNIVGRVVAVKNIDDQVRTQQDLERAVAFDELTGLARKPLALARINEIVEGRRQVGWALICVGVRGLRSVNQAFTYSAGDRVLRAVAQRLVRAAGASDRVARIAGGEFVVLMSDLVTETDAAEAAGRLVAAARGPVDVGATQVEVSTSAGIAMCEPGADAEALLRDATAAMRLAAHSGPDRWAFLDSDVAARSRRDLEIQSRLRDAVAGGQIRAWMMPIVSLADASLAGHEALVRWVQPDGQVLTPDRFLEVAERSHLILEIDRIVLRLGLVALDRLPATQHVAVNVSAATLQAGDIDQLILGELRRSGVDPRRLHLEVTETTLFQATSDVVVAMARLAQAGVSWWVDDFGTGYSSLAHLLNLPIAGVKLDRTFTAGLTEPTSRARDLANGLVSLARGLGLATIAEGVETPQQARILAEQGWDLGQGWLYGRPAPLPG